MTPPVEDVRAWLVARIGHLTALPPGDVDVHAPLTRYGLDSVALIALAADLEKWLGFRFRENPIAAHRTIEALAQFLADQLGTTPAG